jgi:uncharacterized membrane protein
MPPAEHRGSATDLRSSARAAGIVGFAMMAAVDEIVFHQLLGWHHFYDRSTPTVGLLSDGLLHAAELVALVGGFAWYADLRRRDVVDATAAAGGFLAGAGLFQLFDGLVDHKLLRVHQVRYGVDLTRYDVIWNCAGAVLLLIGAALLRRATRR